MLNPFLKSNSIEYKITMTKKLYKLLVEKYLGLSIKSTVAPKPIPTGSGKNNLYVAFTGIAGSGKSTLRRYYLKHSKLVKKRSFKTIQVYAKTLPDKLRGIRADLIVNRVRCSQENLDDKIEILEMDELYQHHLNDTVFLLDTRNIFREFPGALDVFSKKEDKLSDFFRNRIIIHLEISSKEFVKRIKKRRLKTGKMHPYQRELLKSKPLIHLQRDIEFEENKIERLEKLGLRVYHINAEGSLAENTKKIDCILSDQFSHAS